MINKTIEQLDSFINQASLFRRNPIPKSNLDWNIDKIVNKIKTKITKADLKLKESFRTNARKFAEVEEDTKYLIQDKNGNWKYTKDNSAALDEENNKALLIFQSTKIEFEEHIIDIKQIPNNLTFEMIEAFKGIVIPLDYELTFDIKEDGK